MASRKTKAEAEQLKSQFQEWFPGCDIVIRQREEVYDVLESRTCETCGEEFTTQAVGEYNPTRCRNCSENRRANRTAQGQVAECEGREQIARHMAFDEYSE